MALEPTEVKDVIKLHLQGFNPNQIANKLDIHRDTAVKYVNDPIVVEGAKDYKQTLIETRLAALSRVSKQVDSLDKIQPLIDQLVAEFDRDNITILATVELLKSLYSDINVLATYDVTDKAVERLHKISAGYYISHDKLKTQVIPAILASITHHVKDQATLDAIATDLANINLDD